MKPDKLTIDNLGGGEFAAQIAKAFTKVGENIADPNIPTEGVRKIKAVIAIKPDKKGNTAMIVFKVSAELPGSEPGTATAYLAMDSQTKEITLYNADIRQEQLFAEHKESVMTEIKPINQPQKTAPAPQPAKFTPPAATGD
jgi:hypothetical protein